MTGKPFRDGPEYIQATSEDFYTPPSSTYAKVYQIHVVNEDTVTRTFTIWLGATGAEAGGTAISGGLHSLDAGKEADFYFPAGLYITTSDFLVGKASSASKLTVTTSGELFVA